MSALPRINYHRISHGLSRFTASLPITSQRFKSILLFMLFTVLIIQLFLLSSSGRLRERNDKLVIINKDSSISNHFKYLIENHSETFASLPLDQKCNIYFNDLYKNDHDWDLAVDLNKGYDKAAFSHDKYIKDKINDYKKENKDQEPSDAKKAEFEIDFQQMRAATKKIEQKMIDATTHLRVFGQCFLNSKQTSKTSQFINDWFGNEHELESLGHGGSVDLCYDIEQRLFPWMSREFPLFVRWDGETVHGIPNMARYIDNDGYDDVDIPLQSPSNPDFSINGLDSEKSDDLDADIEKAEGGIPVNNADSSKGEGKAAQAKVKRAQRSDCFLNSWRKSLNGKGIILSVASKYESDIIGLIRVLRALNNKLPIQLVHRGDLSEDAQKNIVKAARDDDVKVPLHLYQKVQNHVPHNFPKQEVWFVNAKRCIRKEYDGSFKSFANKLIAYLFNSFDETILMDTDAIPLVKPIELFKTGPYKRTETIFFKDRYVNQKVAQHDSQYFLKLMPSSVDESLFDIPPVGNVTLHNRYISGSYRHSMEAGMLGIRRSTHFTGVLVALQLNLWSAAAGSRVWGDKELFWLGQSIAGNENYEFNKYDAVAVGELTPMNDRPRNTIAHELCSTHPGHLSGDDDFTLLWINSGMKYCKVKDSWKDDIKETRYKNYFKDADELSKLYNSPVRINAVLIPPGGDRKVDNKVDEPSVPWTMTSPCKKYLWCAYDILGASLDPKDRGGYIEYDDLTALTNEYLGKLWLDQDLVYLSKYEEAKIDE